MVEPLSPRADSKLNASAPIPSLDEYLKTPISSRRHVSADALSYVRSSDSSPFETDVGLDADQGKVTKANEGVSPLKTLPSSRSKSQSSPFQPSDIYDERHGHQPPLPPFNLSSHKLSDSWSSTEPAAIPLPPSSPFKENIDASSRRQSPSRPLPRHPQEDDVSEIDERSVASDNTCFSAFSAVPNADAMLFATLGNSTPAAAGRSPRKGHQSGKTSESNIFTTPATSRPRLRDVTSRPASPTPRSTKYASRDGDTTTLLLDFTQTPDMAPKRGQSPMKSATQPDLLSYINNQRNPSPNKQQQAPHTPNKRHTMLNLLDFDLPPQPTPRSIPTITVRELESLKSSYLSDISSLKASLSGREAEAASLKKAVGDAERRVGEAQEQVRSERSAREDAEAAKAEWEKKGKEVQHLLAKVREECISEEREKAELICRLEESNKAREEAELRGEAATSRAAVAAQQLRERPEGDAGLSHTSTASEAANIDVETLVASRVAAQLDTKMENLARELHAVYKRKHEAKVATLKKTYELRTEKRCHDLQAQINDLSRQNDELLAVKDSSLSLELAGASKLNHHKDARKDKDETERLAAQLSESNATISGLEHEMEAIRSAHSHILHDLERERVEKGELVAAVDEMLSLQSEVGVAGAVEDFRRSIGVGAGTPLQGHVQRGSGLVRPGSGLARPGFGSEKAGTERSFSGGGGGMGGSGGMAKSRMLANIERMGSGYGR